MTKSNHAIWSAVFGNLDRNCYLTLQCATSCSPCYCLCFHSLEGARSYFHTWFHIGAYFKFPVALRIIGKTASLLGTRNRKCNWNHKLSDGEEWGIFFIKFHILCVCLAERPLSLLSILISKNNMEEKDGSGGHKSICMKCYFVRQAALRKWRKMVEPFEVLDQSIAREKWARLNYGKASNFC